MDNLQIALKSFLPDEEIEKLAIILRNSIQKNRVTYDDIEELIDGDPEDVLFIANEWGLLYPVKSLKSASWEDRVLFAMPGEVYEIPNIIRYLVKNAIKTGNWDIDISVIEIFKAMGEPKWTLMPQLVRRIRDKSIDYTVNAQQIKRVCLELGLANKINTLIAELKSAGIISPKLGSPKNVFKAHSPIYEINRSLFVTT